MRMVHTARKEAETLTAKWRLREAERHSVPTGEYEIEPGSPVSVWRENK
jgi:hypothetical protein